MASCSLSPQTVASGAKLFAYPVLLIKSFGLLQVNQGRKPENIFKFKTGLLLFRVTLVHSMSTQ